MSFPPPIAAMRGADRARPVERDGVLDRALMAARQLQAHGADLEEIARQAGYTLEQVVKPNKSPRMVAIRRVMAGFLRKRGLSYPEIAAVLGYRDHTTVISLLKGRKEC